MATTDSLWNTKIESAASMSKTSVWAACPLSTLESALNNSKYVPVHATVTAVKLRVKASWQSDGGSGAVGNIRYGFGGSSSINKELQGTTQISGGGNHENIYEYPSDGINIYSYISNKVAPNVSISRENGDYLTFNFTTANWFKKTFYVKSVWLEITYTAGSHSYTTVTSEVAASCLTTGSRTKQCSCGATTKETIPALDHKFGSTTAAKAATCTTAGNSAYKKCSRCNLYFAGSAATNATGGKSDTSSFVTAALGHSYVDTVIPPTCTAQGYTTHVCSRCGHSYVDTYVAAKGHGYDSGVITKQPTCTENGVKTYTCSCGHSYTETIPATGHGPSCYPEITSVQLLYQNKQISSKNKVPSEEYFRIVVGAIAHH